MVASLDESIQRSEWKRAIQSMTAARWPLLALLILGIVLFLAFFGPELAAKDPNRQNIILRLRPPFQAEEDGSIAFPLGSDALGRDILSRLIYGARVSSFVGLSAALIGGLMGTALGLVAGYYGGLIDDVIMRLADIQLAFPFILLLIIFLVVLEPGVINLVLILGFSQWVTYARIARGQTFSVREEEYIHAARAMGARDGQIMLTHIFPNILSPLIVIASFNVAGVILAESALSFLGLGVPLSVPTWGAMLSESRDQLLAGRWWLAIFPALAIMLTVMALNILGDWLRDFLDPRLLE